MRINKLLAIHLAATAVLLVGCDMIIGNDPEKKEAKEAKEVKKNYLDINDITKIPVGFSGNKLTDVENALEILTKPKGVTETTDEYNKRMSILTYDHPDNDNPNALFSFRMAHMLKATYDADTEIMSVHHVGIDGYNFSEFGVCRDANIPEHKGEHPIICSVDNKVQLSISNKNAAFGRYLKPRKKISSEGGRKTLEYDLSDTFKLSKDKVNELLNNNDEDINISVMLLGNIINNQINPLHSGTYAVSGAITPFNLKHIVYYNPETGEILIRRDI